MTKINILAFSNYLVELFANKGAAITHKKLQKLLYYVQAWHLVYFNGNNIFTETAQAWRHGPVYTSVYKIYRENEFNPIMPKESKPLEQIDAEYNKLGLNTDQKEYIDAVLRFYGKKNSFELEILSHMEKPWIDARAGLKSLDRGNKEISLETMRTYYSNLRKK